APFLHLEVPELRRLLDRGLASLGADFLMLFSSAAIDDCRHDGHELGWLHRLLPCLGREGFREIRRVRPTTQPERRHYVSGMPALHTVLFDLDGTLIDSVRLILDSYHHTLAHHG